MDSNIGGYRLDHLIGQGATGEVWLAWDEGAVRRPVAVKRVRVGGGPRGGAELTAEAELLAGVHHPHLVPVIAVVGDGDDLAIVMPYLAGGSLAALLEERGTLGPGEVVALIEPLADAVDALARRGLCHGDLKPGNVMLNGDGEPILVDVGIARTTLSSTTRAEMAGTPEYLDPAVAQGHEPGPSSEVYALGVVAYECLTGRVPHRGEPAQVLAVAAAGVHRSLRSWPTVSGAVADVVESAIDPDPTRRPADAGRFAALLRAAVEADGERTGQPEPIALPGPTRLAAAAPDIAAGHHTVVIDGGPENDPVPPAPSSGIRRRGLAAVAVGVVAVLGLVVIWSEPFPNSSGRGSTPPGPPSSPRTVDDPPCAAPAEPVPDAAGESMALDEAVVDVRADVDGDGCADLVWWDGHQLTVSSTVTADTRAYRMGRPGDQILFGDWDGDGATTPALYRPVTGAVLYVDSFPAEIGDRETATRIEHLDPGGTAEVRTDHPSPGPVRDRVVLADPS